MITFENIERQYKKNLRLAEGIEQEGMKVRLSAEEVYCKQRRKLDSEMRRLGKVRSNFRNKKQYKALVKLAAAQFNAKGKR